jgi:ribosome-interacting GTPase 1
MVDTGEGLLAALQYSTDLFDEADIVRLLDHFEILLHAVVARPDITLDQLNEMLAQTDSRQKLARGKEVEEAGLHKLKTIKRRAVISTPRHDEEGTLCSMSSAPSVVKP